jgi:vacuolar-type H+-ATPase subunit I/STV1
LGQNWLKIGSDEKFGGHAFWGMLYGDMLRMVTRKMVIIVAVCAVVAVLMTIISVTFVYGEMQFSLLKHPGFICGVHHQKNLACHGCGVV